MQSSLGTYQQTRDTVFNIEKILKRGADLEWRCAEAEGNEHHGEAERAVGGCTPLEYLCIDGSSCWSWDDEAKEWVSSEFYDEEDDWGPGAGGTGGDAWVMWRRAIYLLLAAGASTSSFASRNAARKEVGSPPFAFSADDCAALLQTGPPALA